MINALSFDVEDWFQVNNFKSKVKFEDWNKYECRIENNVNKILNILSKKDVKATFFILGWIAENYPELVIKIAENGHEIASHGYGHELVYNQTPEQFEADLKQSLLILRKLTKQKIIGYRAPSFSITSKSLWVFDILKKNGIKYDASVFPIKHPDYGIISSKTRPHQVSDNLMEFPSSTLRLFGTNIPVAGGGYFRVYPYIVTKLAIKKINKTLPAMVYLHPWEFDPKQPKVKLPFLKSFRHYTNLSKTEKKLKKLLNDFRFTTIKNIFLIGKFNV